MTENLLVLRQEEISVYTDYCFLAFTARVFSSNNKHPILSDMKPYMNSRNFSLRFMIVCFMADRFFLFSTLYYLISLTEHNISMYTKYRLTLKICVASTFGSYMQLLVTICRGADNNNAF